MMMNKLDDLTIGEVRTLLRLFPGQCGDDMGLEVGRNYFVRTITDHFTGRLVSVTSSCICLEDAAWIADMGRFSDTLNDPGKLNEVEPSPVPIIIQRAAIVSILPWLYSLPRNQK